MTTQEILSEITQELQHTFSELHPSELDGLQKQILNADRIFVAGAGRSLLMIRGFAMRLMHIGLKSYVVGETITPAIQPGDLLIIASGSGSTSSLVAMAQKCKKFGASLALLTTVPDSPIGQLADYIIEVPAATTKNSDNTRSSVQPGGNTFEQSVLLICDALIIRLTDSMSISETNEQLMSRHANLE
ncbi:6-phospho-3-hexuloisomerase [Clostridium sp. Marseille-P3244]|uniref:6-phospho-3-hexuloisomerase n=1 Tax=Clostridium sp. Marseille-P3244 TaxID=1871020 RepID=UPI0009304D53|nr:6-phospho-3-hexuloisomerase [Clostridium sp. Marseille-P3244]